MEKVSIKSKNLASITKAINALGIKKDLINIMKKQNSLSIKHEAIMMDINKVLILPEGFNELSYVEKEKARKKALIQVFETNRELVEEYNKSQEEMAEISMELLFLIVENEAKAQNEIFKSVAEIYDMTIEDVGELDISELSEKILAIIKSDSFKHFFSLVMK